ncbi:MAG: flagellar hook-basal body complex protein [Enterocloster sp.]
MLRSLFPAVSGMKAHQTKLDVIGNNIANVNTYGFKSSRARFQDVYYQTLQSATGGDNNKGGTNASQVGYGAQLGGVDLDMGRSALQSTGRPMDVAITGEGFFQVMDSDGNIFYTRAGNLHAGFQQRQSGGRQRLHGARRARRSAWKGCQPPTRSI